MGYILIAEDDRDILNLMRRKIELSGYTDIWTTGDGQEALDRALSEPPRLMILDVMLPHVDGLSICSAVKQQLGEKAPPVLVVSARGQRMHFEEASKVGADIYMPKPFSMRDFVDNIRTLIGAA
ncbi:MAG: response regulator transcription factor [Anaerolineae bacterium]|nr:response regulator transcription factor [Anaerolineae bacterium]